MARLEATSKLLYYPTPGIVARAAGSFFKGGRIRAGDPCAGTGAALVDFVSAVDNIAVETWGVELSPARAKEAEKLLDKVLPVSFYSCYPSLWGSRSIGVGFNNPPYDWSDYIDNRSGKHIRHEELFVEQFTGKIVPKGHQVIIIPRGMLGDVTMTGLEHREKMARHLLGWYEEVHVYRFPDGEYERFKQIVIFAISKRNQWKMATREAIDWLCAYSLPTVEIPVLEQNTGDKWEVPEVKGTHKFSYVPVTDSQIARLFAENKTVGTDEYHRLAKQEYIAGQFSPVMPLKKGHIAMMVTSGSVPTLVLENDDGTGVLFKGSTKKVIETEQDPDGTKSIDRERLVSQVTVVDKDGVVLLNEPEKAAKFFEIYAKQLAAAVMKNNRALYDPSNKGNEYRAEWKKLESIAANLPPLPGVDKPGLLEAQRHLVMAAFEAARRNKTVILNEEMGMGKTAQTVALMDLMETWPGIVVVPPHMVWKWYRDVTRVASPERPITPRVITRPVQGKAELVSRFDIAAKIDDYLKRTKVGQVIDTWIVQVLPTVANDPGTRQAIRIIVDEDNVPAVKRWIDKEFTFFVADNRSRVQIFNKYKYQAGVLSVMLGSKDEYTLAMYKEDYEKGRLGNRTVAIVGFEAAKYDAGMLISAYQHEKNKKKRKTKVDEEDDNTRVFDIRPSKRQIIKLNRTDVDYEEPVVCPTCGNIQEGKENNKCRAKILVQRATEESPEAIYRTCGGALYEFSRWRRSGVASMLKRGPYKKMFKFYILDETHKSKGQKTDIGVADQRLISRTKWNAGLTGTIFGGVAGDLFPLLYRRIPELRKVYDFDDVNRWVDHYGLWETHYKHKESNSYYGRSTGIDRRVNGSPKQLPGILPGVIKWLLPITVFANITELGYELPPVYERVEWCEPTDAMKEQYATIRNQMFRDALDTRGGIGTWYSAMICRYQSAYRHEVYSYEDKDGKGFEYEFNALSGWLPKEEKLAELVADRARRGRKTLVYATHTGTTDIRERMKQAIVALAGIPSDRVGVLNTSVDTQKREKWIEDKAKDLDVLIVNPQLVETGLDLIMFSDIIFYETTASLTTLWQALRRVWRLGQRNDVDVVFLAYNGSAEEKLLERMGAKKKAAQVLYGQEAGGVLVSTDAEDDRRESWKALIDDDGPVLTKKKISIFTDGSEVVRREVISESPMGSMVAKSPQVPVSKTPLPSTSGAMQYDMFGGIVAPTHKGKRRR